MKKIILVYGSMSGAIVIGIIIISLLAGGTDSITSSSEWIGYLVMIVSLSLIFFGVKKYRDRELGGVIRFGKAFMVGLGIAAVAGVVYVGVWEIYIHTAGSDFMEKFAESYVSNLEESGASEQELAEAVSLMGYYKELYENPFSRIGITFMEIFPVGLVIALISAALLRNSTFLPAAEPGNAAGDSSMEN